MKSPEMRELDPWGDALTRRLAAVAFCSPLLSRLSSRFTPLW